MYWSLHRDTWCAQPSMPHQHLRVDLKNQHIIHLHTAPTKPHMAGLRRHSDRKFVKLLFQNDLLHSGLQPYASTSARSWTFPRKNNCCAASVNAACSWCPVPNNACANLQWLLPGLCTLDRGPQPAVHPANVLQGFQPCQPHLEEAPPPAMGCISRGFPWTKRAAFVGKIYVFLSSFPDLKR